MERSLLAVVMDGQSGSSESVFALMKFAVLPIAKVFTMCFMGFLMASKYANILPANGRKLLNGMLAPPPGETFDGADEENLPIKVPVNDSASVQVPLLTSKEPEITGHESSRQGKNQMDKYA
ncbi:auxin efflux carrier component [Musa troglodytarum]|uniref:Auxin efflux carrier component n=1 Tax=Musa troglodytarum TaxID=320322 RepID=A0A9E7H6K4_9LILI|nr:auxin efflux carrier component [Musa troglodytarum]